MAAFDPYRRGKGRAVDHMDRELDRLRPCWDRGLDKILWKERQSRPRQWPASQKSSRNGKGASLADRSDTAARHARLWRAGRRVTRESVHLGAIGAALPAAGAVTLAHRLPILAGLSPASAVWQTAEVWRMTLEKPIVFWQAWLALSPLPWQLWRIWATALATGRAHPELALRLTGVGLGAVRRGLAPAHARVVGNARRLNRRARSRPRSR
jgi:hypothetical protein